MPFSKPSSPPAARGARAGICAAGALALSLLLTSAPALASWSAGSCDTPPSGNVVYDSANNALAVCVGTAWTDIPGSIGTYLGTAASSTNPRRSDDVTTGLFSATANTVSVAASGVEAFRVTPSGVNVPSIAYAYYLGGNKILFQPASDTQSLAVGSGALASQSATNFENTAVGYQALNQTTAGFNTAVGTSALKSNTTGTRNTAIGRNAMYWTTTGSYNTAVGAAALFSATPNNLTGSYNVANGAMALYNIQTTAAGNTALGFKAGYTLTTGTSNLILGLGVGSTTLTTGSGNILIGTGSLVDTTASGQSNYLNIGNTIYGDLANGYVGIGSTAPVFALDIVGEGARVTRYETSASGAYLQIHHARGTKTSPTILSSGDQAGKVYFSGYDGSNFIPAGRIEAIVDGTPSTDGNMPGKLQFYTTPQGSSGLNPEQIRMVIDNAGSVGIGTTSPTSKLHIIGGTNATNTGIFRIENKAGSSSNTGASIEFYSKENTPAQVEMARIGTLLANGAAGAADSDLAIATRYDGTLAERMRIAGGSVGIGTASPATGTMLHLRNSTYYYHDLVIDGAAPAIRLADSESGHYSYGINADGSRLDFDLYTYANRLANTVGTHVMSLNSSGQVGIGTAVPAATLDVNGYMKLKTNSSAPVTCGSTYKGAIAYTGGTTNYLCFCNGTSWMQAHSPSTSCTW